jgi:NAD dependent epimerase/dehydratase family enzyme
LGSGQQWLSPISLVDEVAAILWVVDHRLEGPINLVAPTPLTNRTFTRDLAAVLHRPAVAAVPDVALRMALGREMADELVLASQRIEPQRLLESGFAFTHPDAKQALTAALTPA